MAGASCIVRCHSRVSCTTVVPFIRQSETSEICIYDGHAYFSLHLWFISDGHKNNVVLGDTATFIMPKFKNATEHSSASLE